MFRNTSSEYFNCSSRPNPLNIALRHFGSALESLKQNWSIWMQCQNSPGSSSAAPKWIISTQNTNTALAIAGRLQFIFLWNTIQEKLQDDTFFFVFSVVWTKNQAVFWCFVKCLAAFSILVCPTNPLFSLDKAMNVFYSLCCIRYVSAKEGIQLMMLPLKQSIESK